MALHQVNLDIADGEIIGIIGHTGSGKSTLLQTLNGLIKPAEGTIAVGGLEVTAKGADLKAVRRQVGLVFQYPEYQLFEETVAKDVAFGPKNLGLPEAEISQRVENALTLTGLSASEIGDRSPFDLSGGQKRRVAIAGVIAMEPQVLILDEPTAGLDPGAHQEILTMIRTIHARSGATILFVSHNMEDVALLADRVLVMDQGRVVLFDTPEQVFSRREALQAMGLDLPPVTELFFRLREQGLDLGCDVFSRQEATERIAQHLQAEKGGQRQ